MAEKNPENETKEDEYQESLPNSKEDERRKEVWNELKANLKEIKKPKNVLLLGELGTGKSSFIDTVITTLTGKNRCYAVIGSGNLHCSTRLHKISCKEYWDPEKEEDRALNLPNFIDIIGLDVQLSNPNEVDTVNSQMMNLILNGKLPENTDLLDLGMKLDKGKKIVERPEDESLVIDIIVVVVSLEDDKIAHTLLDEIYTEANRKTRQIPVFSVLTKSDKCNDQEMMEKKKKNIAEEISIDDRKILICKNYHADEKPDSRDVEILEFLTKLCDPCLKAVKLQKVEVEEEQASSPDTDTPTTTPNTPTNGCSLM